MKPSALPTALLAFTLALAGCGSDGPETRCRLPTDATVLAVGDSITRGYGADGQGYPEQLQSLLQSDSARSGIRVVNHGIDGERTDGLLARIDTELTQNRPSVVLLTIGGNDLLRKQPEAQTRRNLQTIVGRIRAAGAWPIVFAVPKPMLVAAAGLASDHAMYAELADGGDASVIEDVVGDILAREELRADAIHPNAQGYALMAQAAFGALQRCH